MSEVISPVRPAGRSGSEEPEGSESLPLALAGADSLGVVAEGSGGASLCGAGSGDGAVGESSCGMGAGAARTWEPRASTRMKMYRASIVMGVEA